MAKYPRDFNRDKKLARKEKVDCIFYPKVKDIYPKDYKSYVLVEDLGNSLCGLFRPGHFRGVTTIVTKLFNITLADTAYFGQKDAQQAIIIKRMTQDLNFPIKIKVLPTIREKDGLALSSRNKYLSAKQRKEALVLYESLKKARSLINKGERNSNKIKQIITSIITKKKEAKLEYIDIVDTKNLKSLKKIKGEVLIALACYFGKARLIDNIIVKVR